ADIVVATVPGRTSAPPPEDSGRIDAGPDVIYVVPDDKRLSLDLSKNIIVHFFVPRALVATALTALPPPTAPGETPAFGRFIVPRAILEERVQKLSRLFKFEFMFRADATFEQNFTETVEDMSRAGELQATPSSELTFGEGHDGWTGRA